MMITAGLHRDDGIGTNIERKLCEYYVDTVWILCGCCVDAVWMLCEYCVNTV